MDFDNEKFPEQFLELLDPVIADNDMGLHRADFVDLNKFLKTLDSLTFMEYAFSNANNKCLSLIIDFEELPLDLF